MSLHTTTIVSILLFSPCHAQIFQCPTTEERITTADGSIYAICQQTDYQGDTSKFVGAVATSSDCVNACNRDSACRQAVYDKAAFGCHLKTNNDLVLTQNQAFTTFKFVSKPTQGLTITGCPTGESNITSSPGSIFSLCPNTDYEGLTTNVVEGIISARDCSTACVRNVQCSQAVFQKSSSQCFIKGASKDLRWTYKTGLDTIRTVAKLDDASRVTSCPGGFTNITTDSGAGFATCAFSDFNAPSIEIQDDVLTFEACAERCTKRIDCVQASHDSKNKLCHIKGNLTAPVWTFNQQYTSLQLGNTTSSATAAKLGKWSNVIQFSIIPVAAYVVPGEPSASRLLVFSSWGERAFSGPTGITQFADCNFLTGAVSQRTVANTKHDMFCPGISSLADGRI
ncbi:Galactose oxidase, partial [Ascochyta lentis]